MLGEKPSEKTTIKNDHTEMLPKNVFAKTVGQKIGTIKLAEKASEKTTFKLTVLNWCPKLYRKNNRPKCPYQNASWRRDRENYH